MYTDHSTPQASLDLERGLRQTGGRRVLYWSLLRLFTEHHRDTPAVLQQLLATGDLAGAQRIAHTLRGSAAQIGAVAVEGHAGLMEDALRRGAGCEAVKDLLPTLERSLATLLALLKVHTASLTAPAGGVASPASRSGLDAGEP